ncbi:hypothetical protein FQN55_003666 [Onygenales sp. PD_40]|nr:hypothetical protein FQN55_003666 [Onygenales sp. PD_40]
MSFLTRVTPITRAAMPARAASITVVGPALFSTSASRPEKGPIEITKDTLKKADRVVSDAAVKGIEKGEKAGHKIKDTVGIKTKHAEEAAKSAAKKAENNATYLGEKAKEEAEEYSGKA